MSLTTGTPAEAEEARSQLLATSRAARGAVVADAFALVPKLRGEGRIMLQDVLRGWGLLEESMRLARSRSGVRRCRGLHGLGVLQDPSGRALLLHGLEDRDFAVRRSAMLALVGFPDAEVADALLMAAVRDPRLRRDYLGSVTQIGRPALPALHAELAATLEGHALDDRRGFLAAEGLGLISALESVPTLVAALERRPEDFPLARACVRALGVLGAPAVGPTLADQLGSHSPDVRREAARSLGLLGGPTGIAPLVAALDDPDVQVARAAAAALLRCGPAGMEVLLRHPSPEAAEIVAIAALRSSG